MKKWALIAVAAVAAYMAAVYVAIGQVLADTHPTDF